MKMNFESYTTPHPQQIIVWEASKNYFHNQPEVGYTHCRGWLVVKDKYLMETLPHVYGDSLNYF